MTEVYYSMILLEIFFMGYFRLVYIPKEACATSLARVDGSYS